MGALKYRLRHVGGALIVELAGLVRLGDCAALRPIVQAEIARRPCTKALLDVRKAVVLLSEDDMRLEAEDARRSSMTMPVGILVDPSVERRAARYCLEMQIKGRTRLWFTDEEDAARWLGVRLPVLPPTKSFLPALQVGA